VGKGDKARAVPIYPELEDVIAGYLVTRTERHPDHDLTRPATPLFVHVCGAPLTPRQAQYLIERLYVRAGIRTRVPPGALVHALRHTFATNALAGGANVLEVQLLGHASLATTKRYLDSGPPNPAVPPSGTDVVGANIVRFVDARNQQRASYNQELWIREFLKGAAYLPR
jgi:integrase/recombinase XerC